VNKVLDFVVKNLLISLARVLWRLKEILYISFILLFWGSACCQVPPDIAKINDLRRAHINELWSSGELDCPTLGISIDFNPTIQLGDTTIHSAQVVKTKRSLAFLNLTLSRIWTRRFFFGAGTGFSAEGRILVFLDFKYAPSLGPISPLLSLQGGAMFGTIESDVLPYLTGGIGIRQRLGKRNFIDLHFQYHKRYNSLKLPDTIRNDVNYLVISFRFTALVVYKSDKSHQK